MDKENGEEERERTKGREVKKTKKERWGKDFLIWRNDGVSIYVNMNSIFSWKIYVYFSYNTYFLFSYLFLFN